MLEITVSKKIESCLKKLDKGKGGLTFRYLIYPRDDQRVLTFGTSRHPLVTVRFR